MKKLILIFIAAISISLVYSQNYEIYFKGQILSQNAEITITAHPDSGMIVLDSLDIKNISASTSEVKCIRTIVENVEGTVNTFCWGLCYPPFIDTSTVAVTIKSQDFSYVFSGDHDPNGYVGVVKVKYTFYDSHNPNNQAAVFVNYDANYTANTGKLLPKYFISDAYPNPANNMFSIDYDFTGIKNSSIVIYNLLGTVVEKIDVSGKTGTAKVNTSLYNEGFYFYSLLINDEVIRTQKLIIRH